MVLDAPPQVFGRRRKGSAAEWASSCCSVWSSLSRGRVTSCFFLFLFSRLLFGDALWVLFLFICLLGSLPPLPTPLLLLPPPLFIEGMQCAGSSCFYFVFLFHSLSHFPSPLQLRHSASCRLLSNTILFILSSFYLPLLLLAFTYSLSLFVFVSLLSFLLFYLATSPNLHHDTKI